MEHFIAGFLFQLCGASTPVSFLVIFFFGDFVRKPGQGFPFQILPPVFFQRFIILGIGPFLLIGVVVFVTRKIEWFREKLQVVLFCFPQGFSFHFDHLIEESEGSFICFIVQLPFVRFQHVQIFLGKPRFRAMYAVQIHGVQFFRELIIDVLWFDMEGTQARQQRPH